MFPFLFVTYTKFKIKNNYTEKKCKTTNSDVHSFDLRCSTCQQMCLGVAVIWSTGSKQQGCLLVMLSLGELV